MKNQTLIIIYVDDLIIINFDLIIIIVLKHVLNQYFEINDLNFCIFYFDIIIFKNRNLRKLIFHQNVYVEQIFRSYNM